METSTTEQEIRSNIESLKANIIECKRTKNHEDYTIYEETMNTIARLQRELASEEAKLAPSQKPETKEVTYIINAHGTMISRTSRKSRTSTSSRSIRNLWRGDSEYYEETEYYAITIPEYVELYTFTNIGQSQGCSFTGDNYICGNKFIEEPETFKYINKPAFRYVHESGKPNKFPELFFAGEMIYDYTGYTGIVHCSSRTWRRKQIIYNITARNTQDCSEESIHSNGKPYNTIKNYDEDYKRTLAGLLPLPNSINPCGPILLSEALQVIQEHSKRNYSDTCLIKIYINACLYITDFDRTLAFYERKSTDERLSSARSNLISHSSRHKSRLEQNRAQESTITHAIKEINKTIKNIEGEITQLQQRIIEEESNELQQEDKGRFAELVKNLQIQEEALVSQTELLTKNKENKKRLETGFERYSELAKKDIFNYDYASDITQHNVKSKLIHTNMVKSLDEFKSIDIDEPLVSTYLFMLKHKDGNIIELTIKTDKKSNHAKKFSILEDYLNGALQKLLKTNPSLFSKSFPSKSTISISNPNSENVYKALQKLVSQDGGNNKMLQKKYKSMKHKSRKHKNRKHKSMNHKRMQHKSMKHKSMKHKSMKHKSRKHKSMKHKSRKHKSMKS